MRCFKYFKIREIGSVRTTHDKNIEDTLRNVWDMRSCALLQFKIPKAFIEEDRAEELDQFPVLS